MRRWLLVVLVFAFLGAIVFGPALTYAAGEPNDQNNQTGQQGQSQNGQSGENGQAQMITACPGPGAPITSNTFLAGDLVAGPTDNLCIVFGADNIELFMRGFTIDMRAAAVFGVAIDTNGRNDVSVSGDGGFVVTTNAAPAGPGLGAIHVRAGSNARIRDVNMRNVLAGPPSSAPCAFRGPMMNPGGSGIFLDGVTGAHLQDNFVECYLVGVFVENAGGVAGARRIEHNTIQNGGDGLLMGNSNGWLINRNTLTGNERDGILLGGSTDNQVIGNAADMNGASGIEAFFGSTGNTFARNHATMNSPTFGDLADDNTPPTVVNTWKFNNVCDVQRGDIPSGVCPIALP